MRPTKATVEALDKLATDLKLTPMQRRFCEAYAGDPDHNGQKAAEAAGVNPKTARTRASKWLANANIASYLNQLMAEGRKLAQVKTGEVVGTLAEALALKTAAMRHAHPQAYLRRSASGTLEYDHDAILAAPPGTLKDIERDETGDIRPRFHDAQAAAESLIDHYTGKNRAPEGNKTLVLNILSSLPPDVLRNAVDGLLEAGEDTA